MATPVSNSKDLYHYTENGQHQGPCTGQQLKELARAGKIQPQTMIRKVGNPNWVPASSVKGLLPKTGATAKSAPGRSAPGPEESSGKPPPGSKLMLAGVVGGVLVIGVVLSLILLSMMDFSSSDKPDNKPETKVPVENKPPPVVVEVPKTDGGKPKPVVPENPVVVTPKPPPPKPIEFTGPELLAKYQADPKRTVQELKGRPLTLKIEATWRIDQLEKCIQDNVCNIRYFHRKEKTEEKIKPNETIQLEFPLVNKEDKLGFFNKIKEYAEQRKKNERVVMSITGTLITRTWEKQEYLILQDAVLN